MHLARADKLHIPTTKFSVFLYGIASLWYFKFGAVIVNCFYDSIIKHCLGPVSMLPVLHVAVKTGKITHTKCLCILFTARPNNKHTGPLAPSYCVTIDTHRERIHLWIAFCQIIWCSSYNLHSGFGHPGEKKAPFSITKNYLLKWNF